MKRILFMTVAVAVVFLGCEAGVISLDQESEYQDILRDSEFDYSTVVPVQLNVEVDLTDTTLGNAIGAALATVQVTDSEDGLLFAASAENGQMVSGEILIPARPGAVTLSIHAPGFEPYEVTIENPYQYEQLARLIRLTADPTAEPESDRDGDGIIDLYDAYPDDPDIAFVREVPAGAPLTIAFEDNFPELGDGDYNDFVATYQITEYRSARNNLVKIRGIADALARGAGFDHEFGMVVSFDGLNARGNILRYNHQNELLENVPLSGDGYVRIPIFPSTKQAAFDRGADGVRMDNVKPEANPSTGYSTRFTIIYESISVNSNAAQIWEPYDPYLLVRNTDHNLDLDVHLIGKDPLPDSQNHLYPGEIPAGFRDANGYPRALLVPGDWQWPVEQIEGDPKIETAYPNFERWTATLGASDSDWYHYPVFGEVMVR
ncbi:MAG: LruC domain-containing protein [Spirochaetales bacterium]